MKMDLTEFLLVFTTLWKLTSGLQCYKCEAMTEGYEPLCEHFDYSAKYLKDCDSSSMCYKRITYTQFGTKIYERGCAQQTLKDYQEIVDGKWERVLKINEVYKEGCVENPVDEEVKVTRTDHCYCRGQLCNSAGVLRSNVFALGYTGGLSNTVRVIGISVFAIGVSTIGLIVLR